MIVNETYGYHKYVISINEISFEGISLWESKIKGFPDLVDYADTYEEVLSLAKDSFETTMSVFAEQDRWLDDVSAEEWDAVCKKLMTDRGVML